MAQAEAFVIHGDRLVWEPVVVEGTKGNAWIKSLWKDEESGARTVLVKYDAGYELDECVSGGYADLFVLEGDLVYSGHTCSAGSYIYQPKGLSYGPVKTRDGATVLIMAAGPKATRGSNKPVFIEDINSLPGVPDAEFGKLKVRALRADETAGVRVGISWCHHEGPIHSDVHYHSHSEELYILEGAIEDWEQDVDGNRVFVPGTYLYRPSNASVHGAPTLRKAPYSAIVRLANWSPDDKDVSAVKRPPELVL